MAFKFYRRGIPRKFEKINKVMFSNLSKTLRNERFQGLNTSLSEKKIISFFCVQPKMKFYSPQQFKEKLFFYGDI